jgi:hypothetical protein
MEVLVEWMGQPSNESTWVELPNLEGVPQWLGEFFAVEGSPQCKSGIKINFSEARGAPTGPDPKGPSVKTERSDTLLKSPFVARQDQLKGSAGSTKRAQSTGTIRQD